MADEARVTYRAIANFLSLKKAAAGAKKDLESIRKEEAKTNAASIAGSAKVAAAHRDATKALRARTTSTKTATAAILAHNKALKENTALTRGNGTAAQVAAAKVKVASSTIKDATSNVTAHTKANKDNTVASTAAADASAKVGDAVQNTSRKIGQGAGVMAAWRRRLADMNKEQVRFKGLNGGVVGGLTKVNTAMRKIGNYRPRLIPPFVALVPIIAGLLALLNPLVSVLGAVGAAGFGAGSSLLSVGASALAIIPMIAAAISAVAALVVAFKGIGGVFSKYKAMKDAVGGGGGGGGNVDSYEKRLREATEGLSDAQQDAIWAQEDLNDARKEAVKRLEELRKAVARASTDEEDAAANLQLATENYYNVLADPGSTLGEKMKALAELNEAQQSLVDTRDDAISNADDLAKAEKDGIENDRQVLQAKRRVREAIEAEADAYEKLQSVLNGTDTPGGGGGGGGAVDEFQKALDALSPSARSVVLALIAMEGAWKAVQQAVQEAFFSKIVDDMDDLAGLIPTIGRLLEKAAGAMGNFAHNFLMMVTSSEWKSDFDLISDQNVRIIDLAGDGLLSILTILKDLTIAVGPFAEKFMGGLNGGLTALQGIVANARETGSLASWLDTIYERLQQWWRIVKNVAKTLFNYGAASSEFGKWITDGLEDITEGWLAASEAANKEGSPFQDWLENIKPLLSEIKGLFSDFFGWLGETAMDEGNIAEGTDIIGGLRRLGDAIRGVVDTFSDLGIGSDFVDAITSIVESLDEILANGGAEGFKTFFDIVKGFFGWVADTFKDPFWGPFVKTLIQFGGAMAALSFIGKFTGLTTLFGWLIKLATNPAVTTLFSNLGKLGGLSKIGSLGGLLGGGGTAAAGSAAGTGGAAAAGGSALAATGWGAIIAAAALELGSMIGRGVTNLSEIDTKTKDGSYNATGGIGGSEWKRDSGGALIEGSSGLISAISVITDTFFPELSEGWHSMLKDWGEGLMTFFLGIPGAIEGAGAGIAAWFGGIGPWLEEQGLALYSWLTTDVPYFIGVVAGNIWNFLQGIGPWLLARGTEIYNWAISLPGQIGAWLAGIWNAIPGILTWLSARAYELYIWATGIPAAVGTWLAGIWNSLPGIGNWLAGIGNSIWSWAISLPGKVASWIGNLFSGVTASFVAGFSSTQSGGGIVKGAKKVVGRKAAGGGPIYRATGGSIPSRLNKPGRTYDMQPQGTDTVPTMLTPGEFVVRKAIVDRWGEDSLEKFNAGVIGFGAMMSSKNKGKESTAGVSYFDGGGLAPGSYSPPPVSSSTAKFGQSAGTMIDNSQHFGDITIMYPKRERASESLPTALRKVSYIGGRRKLEPRLGVGAEDE